MEPLIKDNHKLKINQKYSLDWSLMQGLLTTLNIWKWWVIFQKRRLENGWSHHGGLSSRVPMLAFLLFVLVITQTVCLNQYKLTRFNNPVPYVSFTLSSLHTLTNQHMFEYVCAHTHCGLLVYSNYQGIHTTVKKENNALSRCISQHQNHHNHFTKSYQTNQSPMFVLSCPVYI